MIKFFIWRIALFLLFFQICWIGLFFPDVFIFVKENHWHGLFWNFWLVGSYFFEDLFDKEDPSVERNVRLDIICEVIFGYHDRVLGWGNGDRLNSYKNLTIRFSYKLLPPSPMLFESTCKIFYHSSVFVALFFHYNFCLSFLIFERKHFIMATWLPRLTFRAILWPHVS